MLWPKPKAVQWNCRAIRGTCAANNVYAYVNCAPNIQYLITEQEAQSPDFHWVQDPLDLTTYGASSFTVPLWSLTFFFVVALTLMHPLPLF